MNLILKWQPKKKNENEIYFRVLCLSFCWRHLTSLFKYIFHTIKRRKKHRKFGEYKKKLKQKIPRNFFLLSRNILCTVEAPCAKNYLFGYEQLAL